MQNNAEKNSQHRPEFNELLADLCFEGAHYHAVIVESYGSETSRQNPNADDIDVCFHAASAVEMLLKGMLAQKSPDKVWTDVPDQARTGHVDIDDLLLGYTCGMDRLTKKTCNCYGLRSLSSFIDRLREARNCATHLTQSIMGADEAYGLFIVIRDCIRRKLGEDSKAYRALYPSAYQNPVQPPLRALLSLWIEDERNKYLAEEIKDEKQLVEEYGKKIKDLKDEHESLKIETLDDPIQLTIRCSIRVCPVCRFPAFNWIKAHQPVTGWEGTPDDSASVLVIAKDKHLDCPNCDLHWHNIQLDCYSEAKSLDELIASRDGASFDDKWANEILHRVKNAIDCRA